MAKGTDEGKLYVHIIKRSESELAGLSENKISWFILPEEKRNMKIHKVLLTKPSIKRAISAIVPINGYRKIGLKKDKEIKEEYFDEDDNLCYDLVPLEEDSTLELEMSSFNKSEEENFLIKRIAELEMKVQSNEVEKRFVLDKFDKKRNPTEWLEQFETECSRHEVNCATKKLEILRCFVVGPSKDWYEANIKKIGLVNWLEWKNSFRAVFVDKGWSKIRRAYNFKHLGGSLVDYALAKERLCLEAESNCTILSRINMIVVGLPLEVQDQLDREEITTTDKLFTALRKLDDLFGKVKEVSANSKENKKPDRSKEKYEEQNKKLCDTLRKPCFMCEALGWSNRFHPVNYCRNKNLYETKKQINIYETTQQEEVSEMKIKINKESLN